MEVHITPETEAKLDSLARRTHKGKAELLREAIDHLVAYNDWFERKVSDSIAAVDGGETVPDEEVAAWLDPKTGRNHEVFLKIDARSPPKTFPDDGNEAEGESTTWS